MASTAAVLSILVKADGVARTSGQVRGLQGHLSKTDRVAGRMGDGIDTASRRSRRAFGAMKVAAGGVAAGVAGVALVLKKSAEAAIEEEKSNARLRTQLTALGISYQQHKSVIDSVIQKHAQLSGFDDEDLQDSFTNIVRITGDVSKSLKLTGLAADFARAKNMDVAKAGEIVAKVAGGNIGILARYGIVTKDGATATEALGALQKKFAGQAEAYGKTTAGAQDRFRVAVENLQEKIGAFLLPVIERFFNGLTKLITAAQTGEGVFARVAAAFQGTGDKSTTLSKALESLKTTFETVKETVVGVVDIAAAAWDTFGGVITDRAKDMLGVIAGLVEGIMRTLGGLINFIAGVFTGDWSRAWTGIKQIFGGVWKLIVTILDAAWETIKSLIRVQLAAIGALMTAGWNAIKAGVREAWNAVKSVISGAWDAIKNVTTNVAGGVREFLSGTWSAIRERASTAWRNVRDAIVEPIRDAAGFVREKIGDLAGWLSDKWSAIRERVAGFGGNVKDTLVNAFKGAANAVIGFINDIIGAVNAIPGVPDIGKIDKLAMGGTMSRGGVDYFANGGVVRKPMAIVGEEAPRHPEFVIPTNPAYRSRAMGLFGQLGGSLGVPGFATGGILGGGAGAIVDLFEKGASAITGKLPGVGDLPGWLAGMGKYVLGKVTGWIKDKVAGLFKGGDGGGLSGLIGGAAASWPVVSALASRFGLTMTSGFRPGDDGWHGKNRARDYSNSSAPTPEMMRFGQTIAQLMGSKLLELIYTPMGFSIKNGQRTAPFAQADHFDHVHVAMALGGLLHRYGWAGGRPVLGSFAGGTGFVPQTGPYMLHRGEAVVPAANNLPFDVNVFIGDRELTDLVRVEVVEHDRATSGAWRAGALQ